MNIFKWVGDKLTKKNYAIKKQKQLEDLFKNIFIDDVPINTIYHYTNFQGLKGILDSKILWQTHHKYLNDPSEIEHGRNILFNAIIKYVNDEDVRARMIQLVDEVINNYHVYLISFCDKGDYLPAWRYYGDNGAGYSIGFKKEFFYRKEKSKVAPESRMTMYKIEYTEIPLLPDRIIKAFEITNKILHKKQPNYNIAAPILISSLITELPRFKNSDYNDEKEWRICLPRIFMNGEWKPYAFPNKNLFHTELNLQQKSPPFLRNFNTTIPRVNILEFNFSDIDKIFIGPRLDFSMASQTIMKMLADAGASAKEITNIQILPSTKAYQ